MPVAKCWGSTQARFFYNQWCWSRHSGTRKPARLRPRITPFNFARALISEPQYWLESVPLCEETKIGSSFMSDTVSSAGEGNANKELINALLRSRLFRDYESVFRRATGLPLTLRPLEYWQLAHHGKKHENPFCALLAEHPATLGVCLEAHEQMIQHTGVAHHGDVPVRVNRDGGSSEARNQVMICVSASFAACAAKIEHGKWHEPCQARCPFHKQDP